MVALALGGAVGAVAVPRALVEVAPPHAISIAAPSAHRTTRIHVPAFVPAARVSARETPLAPVAPPVAEQDVRLAPSS